MRPHPSRARSRAWRGRRADGRGRATARAASRRRGGSAAARGIRNARPRSGGSAAIPRPASDGPEAAEMPRVEEAHDRAPELEGGRGRRRLAPGRAGGAPPARSRRAARPGVVSPRRSKPGGGQRGGEGRRVDVGGDVALADVVVRGVVRAVGDVAAVGHQRPRPPPRPVQLRGRRAVVERPGRRRRASRRPTSAAHGPTAGRTSRRWPSTSSIPAACQRRQPLGDGGRRELAEDLLEGAVAADGDVDLARPARRGSRRRGPAARRGTRWRRRTRRPGPRRGRRRRPGAGRPRPPARELGAAVLVELDRRVAKGVGERRAVVAEPGEHGQRQGRRRRRRTRGA